MRLAHGGKDDPPPASTGHTSGNQSVTPTTALGHASVTPTTTELVPGPYGCRSKGVDRGTSTMDDAVFDSKGAVVPSSTLCFEMEMERPYLADETALERPSVAAGTTETGRAHISTETKTALERPSVGAAGTELWRSHVAAGTDLQLQCTRVANIDSKITELKDDEKRTGMHHIERHRSCVVILSDIDQVFMRNLIPSTLAFLMKETARLQSRKNMFDLFKVYHRNCTKKIERLLAEFGETVIGRVENMFDLFKVYHRNCTQKTESLLAEFCETLVGRVAPADSGRIKWTGDNSLAENPNCQRAMHLILRLCLSEGCDISSALLCADAMIDPRPGIYGYPVADAAGEINERSIVYFRGHPVRTVAAVDKSHGAPFNYNIFSEGSSSLNTATICLDGSDEEVLASYRKGIGRIRWYCRKKGKSFDLSTVFGPNMEVFTTPEDGTFFLTLLYKNRTLTLTIKARDLYLMGWRTEKGTFEIREDNEKGYMVCRNITQVKCSKNYSLLSPDRNVGFTRVGPSPAREAFEVLFKCRGEPSKHVKQAIGRYAVLFSEAARLHSVFNTVCLSYSDPAFNECQLDNIRYYCESKCKVM